MRRLAAAGLAVPLLAALLSGCIAEPTGTEPTAAPPVQDEAPAPYVFPEDAPTFCDSEADCMFWDEMYHEYVLYEVDTAEIDVLVVPPGSPDPQGDTQTMAAAVRAWDAGIDELGPAWLAENLTIRTYVVGSDTIPPEALQDPEILVLGAEYNPAVLFGIGLEPEQFLCMGLGQEPLWVSPAHEHDGIRVQQAQCLGTGYRCVAVNTNFLMGGSVRMQDLVAHEVGHCLGPGHVGDALDFRAKRVPVQDIMSYQYDPDQVHCVSTLNIAVLEGIYAPVIGSALAAPLAPGTYIDFDPAKYAHVACGNPA